MLIFDNFATLIDANKFAEKVKEKYSLTTNVHQTVESSQKDDIFPFDLFPPIVMVERTYDKNEREIESLVKRYGGTFAGT